MSAIVKSRSQGIAEVLFSSLPRLPQKNVTVYAVNTYNTKISASASRRQRALSSKGKMVARAAGSREGSRQGSRLNSKNLGATTGAGMPEPSNEPGTALERSATGAATEVEEDSSRVQVDAAGAGGASSTRYRRLPEVFDVNSRDTADFCSGRRDAFEEFLQVCSAKPIDLERVQKALHLHPAQLRAQVEQAQAQAQAGVGKSHVAGVGIEIGIGVSQAIPQLSASASGMTSTTGGTVSPANLGATVPPRTGAPGAPALSVMVQKVSAATDLGASRTADYSADPHSTSATSSSSSTDGTVPNHVTFGGTSAVSADTQQQETFRERDVFSTVPLSTKGLNKGKPMVAHELEEWREEFVNRRCPVTGESALTLFCQAAGAARGEAAGAWGGPGMGLGGPGASGGSPTASASGSATGRSRAGGLVHQMRQQMLEASHASMAATQRTQFAAGDPLAQQNQHASTNVGPNLPQQGPESPLHVDTWFNKRLVDAVHLLLDVKAQVDSTWYESVGNRKRTGNNMGRTPLMLASVAAVATDFCTLPGTAARSSAAAAGSAGEDSQESPFLSNAQCKREIVRLLLDYGADVTLEDNVGNTALDVANLCSSDTLGVIRMLELS